VDVKLRVQRYDPSGDRKSQTQEYDITDMPDGATVLDALIHVRENVDETLGMRCSCRSAICGSCAMRINGRAYLGCNTKVSEVAEPGNVVNVEPMGNMPVLKDLIVDFEVFWRKIDQIGPWLKPEGPEPEREYIASNESMLNLLGTVSCIMCGACVSDCTVLEQDEKFLGPAALAKAYRFVGDPRDGHKQDRLEQYTGEGGIWDCTHCFYCVEVCPKGVAPMDWILKLRQEAEEAGFTNHNGVRHSKSFADLVEESGWLDEGKLALDSMGTIKEKLSLVPVGIRSLLHGKMPPTGPLHHKRPGADHVKRIFEELEAKE
jgi:succinate dehydrogenase / fumarate reductase iron-sulfur subunit